MRACQSSPDLSKFTLAQAAKRLGFDCEKTVRRLVKAGKLEAQLCVTGGKRRWMINLVDLNRYRLIHRGWLKRQFARIPPPNSEDLSRIYSYGGWKNHNFHDRLQTYTVAVSIEDFLLFACARPQSKTEYEALKTKIRKKIPGAPQNFQVRYVFDQVTWKNLEAIVRGIRPPLLRTTSEEELQKDAFAHVLVNVLPMLWRIKQKRKWRTYIKQSVRRFYIDKARSAKKQVDIPLSDLADSAELEHRWYASTRKKP